MVREIVGETPDGSTYNGKSCRSFKTDLSGYYVLDVPEFYAAWTLVSDTPAYVPDPKNPRVGDRFVLLAGPEAREVLSVDGNRVLMRRWDHTGKPITNDHMIGATAYGPWPPDRPWPGDQPEPVKAEPAPAAPKDFTSTHRPNPYVGRGAPMCEDCGADGGGMALAKCETPGTGLARVNREYAAMRAMTFENRAFQRRAASETKPRPPVDPFTTVTRSHLNESGWPVRASATKATPWEKSNG